MIVLAILLLLSGTLIAITFGTVGIVVGSLLAMAGAIGFWSELRRRRQLSAEAADATEPASRHAPRARPGWQLFLIIVACVVVSLGGLFSLLWKLTAGLAEVGTAFLESVKVGDLQKARTYFASGMRASLSDDERLRAALKKLGIDQYESVSWTNRSFKNSDGEVVGTVTKKDGGEIVLTLKLVREDADWKILSMTRTGGTLVENATREQPSLVEQKQLVDETTWQFVAAIGARDFTAFHANIAERFKEEASADRLNGAFESVINAGINLQPIINAEPRFTSSGFDPNGYFGLEGNYPLGSKTFSFRYTYAQEDGKWKLVGINVNIR